MTSARQNTPRWLLNAFAILLLLVSVHLLSHRGADPDLWGHIQFGEDWINTGELPDTATHTYTASSFRWINHENLSELTLAISNRLVGGRGIMILRSIAGLVLILLISFLAIERGVPRLAALTIMIPIALALAEFWIPRPQMGTFLCLAILCWILNRAFERWQESGEVRTGWLAAVVPLMILWVNTHGGFAAGLCILLAVLGLRSIECWMIHPQTLRRNLSVFTACGLFATSAIFINPYGAELPIWLLQSVGTPRPEISEWASVLDGGKTIIPFTILTTMTLAAMLLSEEKKDLPQFIIIGLITSQAALHLRHLAIEAILIGFWMPGHFWSAACRLNRGYRRWRPRQHSDAPLKRHEQWFLGIQCVATILFLTGLLGWKTAQFGVDRSKLPVAAIKYMSQNDLSGRLIVSFDWAQYTLAALNPRTTVAFDGRFRTCYPQKVIDMMFDLTAGNNMDYRHRAPESGPYNPTWILEYKDPNLVLLSRAHDAPGIRTLQEQNTWTLLYQDEISQLWGRSAIYDDPTVTTYLDPEKRVFDDRPQSGFEPWPALPERRESSDVASLSL